jgi:hypothetical protein
MAVFSGKDPTAVVAKETKFLVLRKCHCQRGLQPYSEPTGALGAGQVVDVLERRCSEAGVQRFRTRAGWANLHTYNGTETAQQLQQYSPQNPREGTAVLKQLQPHEVPLAQAKFQVCGVMHINMHLVVARATSWLAFITLN